MKASCHLFVIAVVAARCSVQAQVPAATAMLELSVILEPGPMLHGLPQYFTVHLVNVGQDALRIPEPEINCANVGEVGSIVIDESWQPPTGIGLGTGDGVCDRGGVYPAPVAPPMSEVARTWHLVAPGGSLYIRASFVLGHSNFTAAGTHFYSATYLPPRLSEAQSAALREARIAAPTRRALSGSLTFNTEANTSEQH